MKNLFTITVVIFICAACLPMTGCTNEVHEGYSFRETAFAPSKGSASEASSGPVKLKIAVNDTYCKESACECVHFLAAREYNEIQAKLLAGYRIDIELTYFIDEYELENALVSGEYDGAICKPWFAFMLVPEHETDYTRVADILDPFENQMLTGVFLVKTDSPLQSLDDVNGKRLVIGQADSNEKYHMPMLMMEKRKVRPGQLFNKASCTESISMLLDGSADIAVVSDYSLIASCAADLGKEEDFRIIAKTDAIPLCSVIIDRQKVSDAVTLRLQKALLELSGENAPETMLSKGFVKPARWTPVIYNVR